VEQIQEKQVPLPGLVYEADVTNTTGSGNRQNASSSGSAQTAPERQQLQPYVPPPVPAALETSAELVRIPDSTSQEVSPTDI
jgi:hypothetical protein